MIYGYRYSQAMNINSVRPHCRSPGAHRAAGNFLIALLLVMGAARGESADLAPYFVPPAEFAGDFGQYRSVLRFDDGSPVASADDWRLRRSEILETWHSRMGRWPAFVQDHEVEVLATKKLPDGITQKKIRFRWTPNEFTTAYLLIPKGKSKRPAVITVYYEPETAIGEGKPLRDFAIQLARRGFVALSIGTAETTRNHTYAVYWPDRETATVQPLSMLGCAAANAWHLLANQPEVDAERIGIVGHSYGGKWAMFASCLFDKFACAVWSDPGIVFDTRPSVNYWEPWYLGYEPPPWRQRGIITEKNPGGGLYPALLKEGLDLHELHALMAPRPFLVSGGSEDPPRRWQALNRTIEVNNLLGVTNRVAMSNRPKHSPTKESNEVIYEFFEHFLKP